MPLEEAKRKKEMQQPLQKAEGRPFLGADLVDSVTLL
jgi:hypothetical protein